MIVNNIEILNEDAEFFPDGSVRDATLVRNTTIQGIPCLGDRSVVFFPSGRLKLCWLSQTTVLDGIPCLGDCIIYLHENGRLLNASLACDLQIDEVLYPSDSRLTFDETGKLLEYSQRLDADRSIEGFPCSSQFVVWRYASGKPSIIVLSAPHTINGQEYPRGAKVYLNEDGEVIDWELVNLDSGKRYKQQIYGVFEIDWQ
ncbi:hypothetical protein IQ269_15475 [Tychonema sp. LEGE 07199]|uniref:hypothetical protein n=1 Tax=Tychonema sp. LEGE 07196 TaxID=1828665 RepID=UPI00187ED114|nr:hypothetical protein [Tychonema sp. LEGE 07196]MBE9122167.1 hypothetical protein [Tychonema sp. LEGE 07199]